MRVFGLAQWDHSIKVIKQTVAAYGKHPAVWGLSPVNEVGAWTPMDVLRKFYWETYHIVRAGAPRCCVQLDLCESDVPSARRVRLVLGRKRSVRQGVGVPFSVSEVLLSRCGFTEFCKIGLYAAPKLSLVLSNKDCLFETHLLGHSTFWPQPRASAREQSVLSGLCDTTLRTLCRATC